ncbi:MAG: ABC transporter permease [Microcystis wesenbergii Mw_QC_S_20081001_S30D]|jgi:peptide/nickel transport system permease protein|uniref:ABC transporter permease n=1 Tax=Microcystis wesenbergii Mw_QC_S_20081001_S30D TaxID=2486245 RepID=A0A552JM42_9CHRO|nr:ABC transporter permease [Microcystis aeruginosa W11-03]NCR93818.1 ABC transporter permease [Microcystis aeruginosa W11-06]TRU95055.1 MAG: ABC transporter permease [Microcystis wesenbergii Mw_QC_B_20070930_S4D]TRU96769.1 MAG: ABC transporter permease [Microcystis wesenbergii Mw_QC_S_20081001_S30D]TRU98746.1 MAG: ABC transporter permease [Microcystis wesenbergii Mw_QC_S_20081001_S30]TRV08643.1 MAG: ABC transporter permease [Microcystis wesenbergii Mw_QC_B_20070930_S4]
MLKYFLRRLLFSIPTLLAISMVVFGILALAPGEPMGEFAANPAITEAVRENIRKSLGLDQPLPVRYVKWLLAFLQGDMGYSFTSRSPVFTLIWQRLPTTLWIVGSAYMFGVLIAFPLGIISAVKRYSWLDKIISTFSMLGFSLPTFVTGLLLIIIFSVQLNWLPSFYNSTLEINDFNSLIEQVKQSIMPIAVLSLYQGAMLMRFVRSSVTEEIHQEYVKTALAKGLTNFSVLTKHIVRNALIPVVTLIALDIPSIFTGALVTEQVFRVPGIGALLIDSISRSDTPVVMAITFIYGILIVIFNLIADLTYSWLDPRVRY